MRKILSNGYTGHDPPVDKVKDGKIHVLEYALLSLTYYNSTVSHCAN